MSDALEQARKLFANQGLHGNAEFVAALHDGALDYLKQAPVLALCFGAKHNTRADRLYIASRIGGPIARGERLRSVMSIVGIPYPLRKLAANALTPGSRETVRALSLLDNSTLSQIIPEKVGQQRWWLSAMTAYRLRRSYRSGIVGKEEFCWLARETGRSATATVKGEAEDVADYIHAHGKLNWQHWAWSRTLAEVALWHDKLAAEKVLPRGITPTTIIDLSDYPDHSEVEGYEFFKLATPSLLMEEGSRMRHCVASYIPDVMNGRCSIFSLRRDMRRIATLEVAGGKVRQLKGFANKAPSRDVVKAADAFVRPPC